jgi:hypothetical protein
MTNEEANSELGIASRMLAFALIDIQTGQRETFPTRLQTCLFDYGAAIKRHQPKSEPRRSGNDFPDMNRAANSPFYRP